MSHAFNSRLSSDAAADADAAAAAANAASGFSHVVADVLLTTLTSPDFIGGAILFPALFFFARGVVTRICGAAELQSDRGQDTNYSQKAAISSHARSPSSSLSHPSSSSSFPPTPPLHYESKPGHFETSIIHFPTSEAVSEVSERANE